MLTKFFSLLGLGPSKQQVQKNEEINKLGLLVQLRWKKAVETAAKRLSASARRLSASAMRLSASAMRLVANNFSIQKYLIQCNNMETCLQNLKNELRLL